MIDNVHFRAGEWVEVRSKEEILNTLDKQGQLEGLPFMPQMFQYCGRRMQVYKRAHKTCDTVHTYKGRSMNKAVHLEGIRCDGQAYDGCQAACLIFWKEDWLKRIDGPAPEGSASANRVHQPARSASGCLEEDVWAGRKSAAGGSADNPNYICQATQVPAATTPLPWWNFGQYLEDLTSGNVGIPTMVRGFTYMSYSSLVNAGIGLGRPLRWLYDLFQGFRGGIPYPRKQGRAPAGVKTPAVDLNLQPGDWVRVKSYDAILATLDSSNRNRGLVFDAEMVPYCGRSFRVHSRVTRILEEKTGKMTEFKTPCIILEGVICEAKYSDCRLFCPRSIYSYWREIWLERIVQDGANMENRSTPKVAAP